MRRAVLAFLALLLPVATVLALPGGSPEKVTVSPAPAPPSGPSRVLSPEFGDRPAVNAYALNDALAVYQQTKMDASLRWNARVELNRVEALRQRVIRSGSSGTAGIRHPAPVSTLPSTLPITGDYHTWPDWPLWRAVGLCEQGAEAGTQWDTHGDGIAWGGSPIGGLPGSGYPGGLGESVDFWNQFRIPAGVTTTNGAYASPGEQIRVARAGSHDGTRMGGWSSWPGCVQAHMRG